jgi:hypothetical protein
VQRGRSLVAGTTLREEADHHPYLPLDTGAARAFSPEGATEHSPGRGPGSRSEPHCWVQALKGRNKRRAPYAAYATIGPAAKEPYFALSGLRADWVPPDPGRCPGLC